MRRFERLRRALDVRQSADIAREKEDAFVRGIIAFFDKSRAALLSEEQSLRVRISETEAQIQSLYSGDTSHALLLQHVGELQTRLKQWSGQYDGIGVRILQSQAPAIVDLRRQYHAIMATPRCRQVEVRGDRVVVLTECLYGKDHSGQWRRIGPFDISFDIANPILASIEWTNLDGARGKYHGPPNIYDFSTTGGPGTVSCAGPDATGILNLAAKKRDYATIVAVAIRYPECPGASATTIMKTWPVVDSMQVPPWYLRQFGR